MKKKEKKDRRAADNIRKLFYPPPLRFSDKAVKQVIGQTKRWVIQGGVFTPFTAIAPAHAITYILKKRWPPAAVSKIIVICVDRGSKSHWIFDEDELTRLGQWCMTHPKYVLKMYKQWKKDARQFYHMLAKLHKVGIKDALNDYFRFYKAYLYVFSAPLVQEYYTLAGNEFIRQLNIKYGQSKKLQKSIDVFSQPIKLTFIQSAELAMNELALFFYNKKLPKSLVNFRKKHPEYLKKVERIQRDYFWIHFSYRDTIPHSISYFYQQIFSLISQKKRNELHKRLHFLKGYGKRAKQRQQVEMAKTQLTGQEVRLLKQLGFITHWHDQRKQANLLGSYWCNNFLQLLSKPGEYSLDELQQLTPAEFVKFLRSERCPVTRLELRKRMTGSLFVNFFSGQEGMTTGRYYQKIWNIIKKANYPKQAKQLSGITASSGVYTGRVRKIETPKRQGKTFKSGEVLVAYMTRPDCMHFIYKAGAIITDEGGLTSHAAIIARELKVPCVVGTRFAMRVLKNGDRVEVDANKGIIRKL